MSYFDARIQNEHENGEGNQRDNSYSNVHKQLVAPTLFFNSFKRVSAFLDVSLRGDAHAYALLFLVVVRDEVNDSDGPDQYKREDEEQVAKFLPWIDERDRHLRLRGNYVACPPVRFSGLF